MKLAGAIRRRRSLVRVHLLRAGLHLEPGIQLVLLAGAADTAGLAAETDAAVAHLRAARDGVTGLLVHYDPDDTTGFERDLAAAMGP